MKKKLIAMGLVVVLAISGTQMAGATTLSKAKNQKNQAQSNLNSVNSQIDSIKSQQSALQSQINQVDSELVQVLVDLDVVAGEIENKKVELAQAEADLETAKAKEAEQYGSMKERIRYMYENGDSSFLDALVGAQNFADNFSKVYDYDRNLLVEYQNTKTEVANLVAQVEEEKQELEENQATYQEQQQQLETLKAEKSSQMDNFGSKLAEAQSLAAQYKQTIDQQNAIIAQELAAAQTVRVTAGASSVANNSSAASSNKKNNTTSSNSGSSNSNSSTSGSSSDSGSASTGSGSGSAVVNYACQFVGNPYVWGGTSLTNGADCSGFIMSVYAHFGVSLPHSSSAMRGVGREVSVSDMQPGDIVCYSGHVAIYMGGGQIVHASSPSTGIKISGNVHYKTILTVRRIF